MGDVSDHVVVIDANRELVSDPEEKYALKIDSRTLSACVGDGVQLLGIPEIILFVKQPVGKRKRHGGSRKVSAEMHRKQNRGKQ